MIVILTTCYNASPFIKECIDSMKIQNNNNWKCYIMNDLSTDDSLNVVMENVKGDDRFVVINNTEKHWQFRNYHQVITNKEIVSDEDICVTLDIDDYFPDSEVLNRVEGYYKDGNTLVTHGQFKYDNGRIGFTRPPVDVNNPRNSPFTLSHLRTFKAFLFRNIKEEDYIVNGKWPECAGDTFFTYPIFEMAGINRIKFVNDINMVYRLHSLNEHVVNMKTQQECANWVRHKAGKYKLL